MLEDIYEANSDAIVIVEEEGKECIIEHGKQLDFVPSTGKPGQVLTKTEEGNEFMDLDIPEDVLTKQDADKVYATKEDLENFEALPEGGTEGQGLARTADGYEWRDEEITEDGGIIIGDNTLTPVLVDGEPEENAALVSDGEGGVKWNIITGLPGGGKVGQIILMTESGPKWVDVSEIIPKD